VFVYQTSDVHNSRAGLLLDEKQVFNQETGRKYVAKEAFTASGNLLRGTC